MTTSKTCLTCRHWQSTPERTSGICRRNAPITIPVLAPTAGGMSGSVLKTVWPSTGPADYCGEWAEALP